MSDPTRTIPPQFAEAREQFLALVAEVRPELHRYCARIVGSAVQGEDIVQETLAKAFYAITMATEVPALRPWLFRVAHNTALDHLKRYEQRHVESRADLDDGSVAAGDEPADPAATRDALSTFLGLAVQQRCAVILKDVLGHSLEESADTMGTTVSAVKAALVRGRAALRSRRREDEGAETPRAAIEPEERARLQRYASLFQARDWDGLTALMAEECRLDLVARASRQGREIRGYFARYAAEPEFRVTVGTADGQPALLYFKSAAATRPAYFILLTWRGDEVVSIRDFRYVTYITEDTALSAD